MFIEQHGTESKAMHGDHVMQYKADSIEIPSKLV